jgi:hypothetical protein
MVSTHIYIIYFTYAFFLRNCVFRYHLPKKTLLQGVFLEYRQFFHIKLSFVDMHLNALLLESSSLPLNLRLSREISHWQDLMTQGVRLHLLKSTGILFQHFNFSR